MDDYFQAQIVSLGRLARKAFGDDCTRVEACGEVAGEPTVYITIFNNLSKRWAEVFSGVLSDAFEWVEKGGM